MRFLIAGLFEGAVFGLLAVGLVLVYKGARVFNFAQGEFGTVAAFTVWALLGAGWPYPAAIVVGLLAAVVTGLIMERLVVRPLLDASRITLLVATVGFALFIIAITVLAAQPEPRSLQPLIGGEDRDILGAAVSPQRMVIALVLIGLAVALAWFFNRTNRGLAVLATSQDALATRAVGISVPGMSRFIWGFAALLGGIAGVLQAPIDIFYPGFMTRTSLVPAFTAAVLGGFTSLPGAFLGGELVGVVHSLGLHVLKDNWNVPGAGELTLFVLLLAVLLARPQGLLGKEA
ncbi:MAG: branched-chain amino acid ABC transporter permease [Actinobacteria bacterium]|nr:branched-chain amino acid ABC transporter permease [Actinomycetota bacterium]